MKYLILPLILFVTGCTDSDVSLDTELRETKYMLSACQTEVQALRKPEDTSFNNPPAEPAYEAPKEPEYEEVNVYEVDGTKCYATDDIDSTTPACGRSFWRCNDNVLRECMTNVKYKIKTERKLVQDEE